MNVSGYFPLLTSRQKEQIDMLPHLYREWNSRINVISRKDIADFEIHHLLYSLAIARIFSFSLGTSIMDAGTGGGLPGIPLAIVFPEVDFTLVDSIGKKVHVVEEISKALGLTNVTPLKSRFEDVPGTFDFITGRAIITLPELFRVLRNKVSRDDKNDFRNGIIYMKGGDFSDELARIPAESTIWDIYEYFQFPYFETKKIVHLFGFV